VHESDSCGSSCGKSECNTEINEDRKNDRTHYECPTIFRSVLLSHNHQDGKIIRYFRAVFSAYNLYLLVLKINLHKIIWATASRVCSHCLQVDNILYSLPPGYSIYTFFEPQIGHASSFYILLLRQSLY